MTLKHNTMPQLGESVTEGTINTWLVSVGDHVQKYDPIAEIMTDKVNAEVPSSYTGTIKEIITEEGTTIAVGDLMCTIDTVEDGGEETKEESSPSKESTESKTTESVDDKESGKSMKNRFSPAVMRLAQENDIDLTQVSGTGAGGRITRKDIEKVIKEGVAKQERPTEPSKPSAPV